MVLTKTKIKILDLTAQGFSSKVIADKLGLSRRTVEKYILDMKFEYNCLNVVSLVVFAIKNNIIQIL